MVGAPPAAGELTESEVLTIPAWPEARETADPVMVTSLVTVVATPPLAGVLTETDVETMPTCPDERSSPEERAPPVGVDSGTLTTDVTVTGERVTPFETGVEREVTVEDSPGTGPVAPVGYVALEKGPDVAIPLLPVPLGLGLPGKPVEAVAPEFADTEVPLLKGPGTDDKLSGGEIPVGKAIDGVMLARCVTTLPPVKPPLLAEDTSDLDRDSAAVTGQIV